MKNYFAFLLFVVTLCSCETYNSDFPVDVVSNSIPSDDLLGEWYFAGKKDGEFHLYSALDICPMNEKEYLLKLTIYDHEERTIDQVNNYRLFKSKIDTVEFINIQSLSNTDQNTYSLWKYNINIALLRSYYLGRSFDKVFNSTQEYYNYVKDNSKEFASQFDTLKQYYFRPFGFPWTFVNDNSLEQLESFHLITVDLINVDYRSMTDQEVKQQTSKKIDIKLTKNKLLSYHFSNKPISVMSPVPKHAFMTFIDGSIKRLKIYNEDEIYDVDEKRLFVWDQTNNEERTHWINANN